MKNKSLNEVGVVFTARQGPSVFRIRSIFGLCCRRARQRRLPVPFLPILPMRQKNVAHFGVTVCRKSLKNEPLGKIDMKILKVAVALGLATSLSGCLSDDDTDVDVVSMARTLLTEVDADGVKTFQLNQIDPSSTATMNGYRGSVLGFGAS